MLKVWHGNYLTVGSKQVQLSRDMQYAERSTKLKVLVEMGQRKKQRTARSDWNISSMTHVPGLGLKPVVTISRGLDLQLNRAGVTEGQVGTASEKMMFMANDFRTCGVLMLEQRSPLQRGMKQDGYTNGDGHHDSAAVVQKCRMI